MGTGGDGFRSDGYGRGSGSMSVPVQFSSAMSHKDHIKWTAQITVRYYTDKAQWSCLQVQVAVGDALYRRKNHTDIASDHCVHSLLQAVPTAARTVWYRQECYACLLLGSNTTTSASPCWLHAASLSPAYAQTTATTFSCCNSHQHLFIDVYFVFITITIITQTRLIYICKWKFAMLLVSVPSKKLKYKRKSLASFPSGVCVPPSRTSIEACLYAGPMRSPRGGMCSVVRLPSLSLSDGACVCCGTPSSLDQACRIGWWGGPRER